MRPKGRKRGVFWQYACLDMPKFQDLRSLKRTCFGDFSRTLHFG